MSISFAFGSSITTGGGTPSWGTALGQSQPDYKFTYPGAEDMVLGMAYCAVPLEAVTLPLGKGGHVYKAIEVDGCVLVSLFRKVYINGKVFINILNDHIFLGPSSHLNLVCTY